MLKNIPNALTIVRFILIPFIVYYILTGKYIAGFVILTISGLTDVLDGCNKLTGVYMAVRSLSPQVVAMDEIGGEDDIKAVKYCIKSGCSVIGTAHGSGIYDTDERLAGLFGKNGFKRAVILEKCGEAGKCLDI